MKKKMTTIKFRGGGEEEGNTCHEYMMLVFEGK